MFISSSILKFQIRRNNLLFCHCQRPGRVVLHPSSPTAPPPFTLYKSNPFHLKSRLVQHSKQNVPVFLLWWENEFVHLLIAFLSEWRYQSLVLLPPKIAFSLHTNPSFGTLNNVAVNYVKSELNQAINLKPQSDLILFSCNTGVT